MSDLGLAKITINGGKRYDISGVLDLSADVVDEKNIQISLNNISIDETGPDSALPDNVGFRLQLAGDYSGVSLKNISYSSVPSLDSSNTVAFTISESNTWITKVGSIISLNLDVIDLSNNDPSNNAVSDTLNIDVTIVSIHGENGLIRLSDASENVWDVNESYNNTMSNVLKGIVSTYSGYSISDISLVRQLKYTGLLNNNFTATTNSISDLSYFASELRNAWSNFNSYAGTYELDVFLADITGVNRYVIKHTITFKYPISVLDLGYLNDYNVYLDESNVQVINKSTGDSYDQQIISGSYPDLNQTITNGVLFDISRSLPSATVNDLIGVSMGELETDIDSAHANGYTYNFNSIYINSTDSVMTTLFSYINGDISSVISLPSVKIIGLRGVLDVSGNNETVNSANNATHTFTLNVSSTVNGQTTMHEFDNVAIIKPTYKNYEGDLITMVTPSDYTEDSSGGVVTVTVKTYGVRDIDMDIELQDTQGFIYKETLQLTVENNENSELTTNINGVMPDWKTTGGIDVLGVANGYYLFPTIEELLNMKKPVYTDSGEPGRIYDYSANSYDFGNFVRLVKVTAFDGSDNEIILDASTNPEGLNINDVSINTYTDSFGYQYESEYNQFENDNFIQRLSTNGSITLTYFTINSDMKKSGNYTLEYDAENFVQATKSIAFFKVRGSDVTNGDDDVTLSNVSVIEVSGNAYVYQTKTTDQIKNELFNQLSTAGYEYVSEDGDVRDVSVNDFVLKMSEQTGYSYTVSDVNIGVSNLKFSFNADLEEIDGDPVYSRLTITYDNLGSLSSVNLRNTEVSSPDGNVSNIYVKTNTLTRDDIESINNGTKTMYYRVNESALPENIITDVKLFYIQGEFVINSVVAYENTETSKQTISGLTAYTTYQVDNENTKFDTYFINDGNGKPYMIIKPKAEFDINTDKYIGVRSIGMLFTPSGSYKDGFFDAVYEYDFQEQSITNIGNVTANSVFTNNSTVYINNGQSQIGYRYIDLTHPDLSDAIDVNKPQKAIALQLNTSGFFDNYTLVNYYEAFVGTEVNTGGFINPTQTSKYSEVDATSYAVTVNTSEYTSNQANTGKIATYTLISDTSLTNTNNVLSASTTQDINVIPVLTASADISANPGGVRAYNESNTDYVSKYTVVFSDISGGYTDATNSYVENEGTLTALDKNNTVSGSPTDNVVASGVSITDNVQTYNITVDSVQYNWSVFTAPTTDKTASAALFLNTGTGGSFEYYQTTPGTTIQKIVKQLTYTQLLDTDGSSRNYNVSYNYNPTSITNATGSQPTKTYTQTGTITYNYAGSTVYNGSTAVATQTHTATETFTRTADDNTVTLSSTTNTVTLNLDNDYDADIDTLIQGVTATYWDNVRDDTLTSETANLTDYTNTSIQINSGIVVSYNGGSISNYVSDVDSRKTISTIKIIYTNPYDSSETASYTITATVEGINLAPTIVLSKAEFEMSSGTKNLDGDVFTISDNDTVQSTTFTIKAGSYKYASYPNSIVSSAVTGTATTIDVSVPGYYIIDVTATDNDGNITILNNQIVKVVDSTVHTVTYPSSDTVDLNGTLTIDETKSGSIANLVTVTKTVTAYKKYSSYASGDLSTRLTETTTGTITTANIDSSIPSEYTVSYSSSNIAAETNGLYATPTVDANTSITLTVQDQTTNTLTIPTETGGSYNLNDTSVPSNTDLASTGTLGTALEGAVTYDLTGSYKLNAYATGSSLTDKLAQTNVTAISGIVNTVPGQYNIESSIVIPNYDTNLITIEVNSGANTSGTKTASQDFRVIDNVANTLTIPTETGGSYNLNDASVPSNTDLASTGTLGAALEADVTYDLTGSYKLNAYATGSSLTDKLAQTNVTAISGVVNTVPGQYNIEYGIDIPAYDTNLITIEVNSGTNTSGTKTASQDFRVIDNVANSITLPSGQYVIQVGNETAVNNNMVLSSSGSLGPELEADVVADLSGSYKLAEYYTGGNRTARLVQTAVSGSDLNVVNAFVPSYFNIVYSLDLPTYDANLVSINVTNSPSTLEMKVIDTALPLLSIDGNIDPTGSTIVETADFGTLALDVEDNAGVAITKYAVITQIQKLDTSGSDVVITPYYSLSQSLKTKDVVDSSVNEVIEIDVSTLTQGQAVSELQTVQILVNGSTTQLVLDLDEANILGGTTLVPSPSATISYLVTVQPMTLEGQYVAIGKEEVILVRNAGPSVTANEIQAIPTVLPNDFGTAVITEVPTASSSDNQRFSMIQFF
jgi:hypothetical protein